MRRARAPRAESVVIAHHDRPRLERLAHAPQKRFRLYGGKFPGKPAHHHAIHAQLFQRGELFFQRHQRHGRALRTKRRQRVAVVRIHHGWHAQRARLLQRAMDQCPVPGVYAIERAHGHHGSAAHEFPLILIHIHSLFSRSMARKRTLPSS